MISPDDIKQQALKWWKPFLQSILSGETFFPKEIGRIGKTRPADITHRFDVLQDEIAVLYKRSKNETGSGYVVKTAEKNFRRTGTHELPDNIIFETAGDYLDFIRKKAEWERFCRNYALITKSIPAMHSWVYNDPLPLTIPEVDWEGILAVCTYFIAESQTKPLYPAVTRCCPYQIHRGQRTITAVLAGFSNPGTHPRQQAQETRRTLFSSPGRAVDPVEDAGPGVGLAESYRGY